MIAHLSRIEEILQDARLITRESASTENRECTAKNDAYANEASSCWLSSSTLAMPDSFAKSCACCSKWIARSRSPSRFGVGAYRRS